MRFGNITSPGVLVGAETRVDLLSCKQSVIVLKVYDVSLLL